MRRLKTHQEELNSTKDLIYWTSNSLAEVDFLIQYDNEIIPIDVKSGKNRNIKSHRSYANKYHP